MTYACFKGKFCNISLISVYVPILLADDRDKYRFFLRNLVVNKEPKYDTVIIGGDWNRVGHNAAAMI